MITIEPGDKIGRCEKCGLLVFVPAGSARMVWPGGHADGSVVDCIGCNAHALRLADPARLLAGDPLAQGKGRGAHADGDAGAGAKGTAAG